MIADEKLDVSVIVPTFCEAENLPVLVPRIAKALAGANLVGEIIVVDDASPDATEEVCRELAETYSLRLEVRRSERGLSGAVLRGMELARGRVLLVMDADLSHPPEKIPELVAALADHETDFVIGSRYVAGGKTSEGWGLLRWLNSKVATWLARPLTTAKDPMAGFFALRREQFQKAAPLDPIGYKIGLELIVKCGCRRVREIPITFELRLHGESKLTLKQQLLYLNHVVRLMRFKYGKAGRKQRRASSPTQKVGGRKWRKVLFPLLAVAGGLLLGCFAAEIGLMFYEPPRLRSARELRNLDIQNLAYFCYSSNPNDELQPVPDVSQGQWKLFDITFEATEIPINQLSETPWCVKIEFSEQNLRDRFYGPMPAAGVLRIAGMGDSFAFGQGVPIEKTLFRQMERFLGDGYEVVNGARVGIDTRIEAQLLPQVVAGLNCPRAIVVFIVNDISLNPQLMTRQKYVNDLINIRDRYLEKHEAEAWYTGHSRLLHMVGSWLEMRRIEQNTLQWYRDSYKEEFNKGNLNQLEADLRSIAATPNCRVAFVIYPLMEGLEGTYPLRDVHEKVANMAREAGLPTLDLTPHFEGRKTTTLQVHPTDHHPNGKAHAIAAEAIVNWLREDVPGFLER